MSEIWPESIVEDNNLTVSISALRKILGQGKAQNIYIETITKRGYCFVADVKEILKAGGSVGETNPKELATGTRSNRKRKINSIAVLPFLETIGDAESEYLCDGITEGLINALSRLPSFKVMAFSTVSRYKNRIIAPLEAGQEMGVRGVLIGRVNLSDNIMMSMELVDVSDGSQIWSDRYSRPVSDILRTQEEIVEEISDRLELKLSDQERRQLSKRYTADTEAYHRYLKGRFFWNKYTHEGVKKALGYFQQAIEIDPNYALAYAGLADCFYRLSNTYMSPADALPKAKAAAQKSVDLDDRLSEAHASLGIVKLFYDHDWSGAEKEYKRAIELNRGSSLAYKRYGEYLMLMGRHKKALTQYKKALRLDPLSLQINVILGTNFYLMQQYDLAIQQIEKTLEMDPNYFPPYVILGMIYLQKHDFEKAIKEFQRAYELEKTSTLPLGFLGHTYALSGNTSKAHKILNGLKRQSQRRYVSSYNVAIIYLGLGNKDQAISWLEKSYDEHCDWLGWLRVAPELNAIRSDPRFMTLMRLVGIKSYLRK